MTTENRMDISEENIDALVPALRTARIAVVRAIVDRLESASSLDCGEDFLRSEELRRLCNLLKEYILRKLVDGYIRSVSLCLCFLPILTSPGPATCLQMS